MKIKLSKSQWEQIGKTAGWIKKASIFDNDTSQEMREEYIARKPWMSQPGVCTCHEPTISSSALNPQHCSKCKKLLPHIAERNESNKRQKTIYAELEKDVSDINKFWTPVLQTKKTIDATNFSIGQHKFTSIADAIEFLRSVYRKVRMAEKEDTSNANLYNGWKNNITACANMLKDVLKKHQQPELF